jgi:four helix bundle protein
MKEMDSQPKYTQIETLEFFQDLEGLSDEIWGKVSDWKPFWRDTTGLQLVRAMDSIGANLVEGDGRHSDKESLHFFSIARGSAREARFWLNRCYKRNMMEPSVTESYLARLTSIMKRLNALITARRQNAYQIKENTSVYLSEESDSNSF